MAALQWSDALVLGLEPMDDTHREFVALMAAVEAAPDDAQGHAWNALVVHTEAHFAQEDAWMAATRFAAGNCHSVQHQVVLQVMREGAALAAQGDRQVLRVLAVELGQWFAQHAQTADAALALHLRRVGFDATTGRVAMPEAFPPAPIAGCGAAHCAEPAHQADPSPFPG